MKLFWPITFGIFTANILTVLFLSTAINIALDRREAAAAQGTISVTVVDQSDIMTIPEDEIPVIDPSTPLPDNSEQLKAWRAIPVEPLDPSDLNAIEPQ